MSYLLNVFIDYLAKFSIPKEIAFILFPILPFCIIALVLVFVVLFLVLFERKVLALFTQRKGPNRVGVFGILQTVADAIKILCKENIEPNARDKFLFMLAPILVFTPIMICFGLIPFCSLFDIFSSTSISAFLFVVIALYPIIGIIMAGYSSNNKYSIISMARAVAQGISYEIPLMFGLLSVVVFSSSLDIKAIILSQTSNTLCFGWHIFPCFLSFIIMFISALAELNRCPFDLQEAESELVAGYHTEYSGMRFALFFLGEYAMLFAMSAFIVALFFGGYLSPFGIFIAEKTTLSSLLGQILIYTEQVFWFSLKTLLLIFIIIWIRATLPRFKYSSLLLFSWKYLVPLSIINFIYICILKYFLINGGSF